MRKQLLCLLLPAMAKPALCAENSPALVPMPDPQSALPVPSSLGPTQTTLHDIRGPVPLPDPPDLLFWFLIALALLIMAGLFLYIRKRRKKEPPPPLSHEIALRELDLLRSLMNEAQALLYADQLAELLRRYLEARFRIPSTRQTTREFLLDLGKKSPPGNNLAQHHERLRNCLEQCDLSKFAHFTPGRQGLEAMEQAVRDFIMATGQPRPGRGEK
jgi:hypothetical protein